MGGRQKSYDFSTLAGIFLLSAAHRIDALRADFQHIAFNRLNAFYSDIGGGNCYDLSEGGASVASALTGPLNSISDKAAFAGIIIFAIS